MKSSRPRKARPEDINRAALKELNMTLDDWKEFEHGVELFNAGRFWHAHEAWEMVWQRHVEDERLFLQGLIQLAAAYHHLFVTQNHRGVLNNFEKARTKLEPFSPEYLGVNVQPLVKFIELGKEEAGRLGSRELGQFNCNLVPKLQFHKPDNPDLVTEIREILRSDGFQEGVRLFNAGYHWEAHEVWEDVWREHEGDAKMFVQAFVQSAAGYSFVKQNKPGSAKYLFEKAIEKLQQFEKLKCCQATRGLIGGMNDAVLWMSGAPPQNGNALPKAPAPPMIILDPS
jgi:predicted metal-dependent hydrolase